MSNAKSIEGYVLVNFEDEKSSSFPKEIFLNHTVTVKSATEASTQFAADQK